MNKKIIALLLILTFLFFFKNSAFAVENPLETSNNKFGVHILFPEEITDAARLFNSNGGDWGYLTIPIQAGDKDIVKWQKFMDQAKILHVIPIIRVSTEGDYFDKKVWRKPTYEDMLDFANFLNSLEWPIKNRYIIILNEVNRRDEWGEDVNPGEYALLLKFAVDVFKSKNQDFFVIPAGLDNAAANVNKEYMNEYDFMKEMNRTVPGIFNMVDGLSSHSYPNPGFSQPPSSLTTKSIASFKFEKNLVRELSGKDLPVFITETGWDLNKVNESKAALYFENAFDYVWNDQDIVAITPFLLRAGNPFTGFSLINSYEGPTLSYKAIEKIKKIKGSPVILDSASEEKSADYSKLLPEKDFINNSADDSKKTQLIIEFNALKTIFKWLMSA